MRDLEWSPIVGDHGKSLNRWWKNPESPPETDAIETSHESGVDVYLILNNMCTWNLAIIVSVSPPVMTLQCKNLGFPCFFSGSVLWFCSIASQAMAVLRLCGCKWCQLFWQSHRRWKSSVYLINHRKKKNTFIQKGTKKRKLRPIAWIHTHIKLCENCVCDHLKNENSSWDVPG